MIFKVKQFTAVILILCVCVVAALSVSFSRRYILTSAKAQVLPQVILDAGHGGFDGGAVAQDGTVEKDINLNITLAVANFLKQSGFEVILTRQNDVSTDDVESDKIATRKKSDLKNRLNLMKDYPEAVFVSVHLNKFTTSAASGSQVFYSKGSESEKLGECIQNSIVNYLQPENVRVNKQATKSMYLLYNATVPSVLVECGFLSNKAELEKLKNTEYQNKMAFCIYSGILEYFKGEK